MPQQYDVQGPDGTPASVPQVTLIMPGVPGHGLVAGAGPEVEQLEVDTNRVHKPLEATEASWVPRFAIPQSLSDLLGDAALHVSTVVLSVHIIVFAPPVFKLMTIGTWLVFAYVGKFYSKQSPALARTAKYRLILTQVGIFLGILLSLAMIMAPYVEPYLPASPQTEVRQ